MRCFRVLFLFCSSHLKVKKLKLHTLKVIFTNIDKIGASSSSFLENMMLSHNMLMSSGVESILVRKPIVHLFLEIILRYLPMVLSFFFSGLLENGECFKTLFFFLCLSLVLLVGSIFPFFLFFFLN